MTGFRRVPIRASAGESASRIANQILFGERLVPMISRRHFIYGAAATPVALSIPAWASISGNLSNTGNNPTSVENMNNPGTLSWQIGLSGYSRSDDSSLQIKGYASATSINKGESITFYVTVNPTPQTYNIDVYRIGWYNGNGGELKVHVAGLSGVSQPAPTY